MEYFPEWTDAIDWCDCRIEIDGKSGIGDRHGQGYTFNHLGLALAGLGDLDAAREAFSQALDIRHELSQEALVMDDLAGLARVALSQDDRPTALAHANQILAWLEENGT